MILEGQGILITGGSLGIGKAIAKACIESGASVLICARNEQDLERARGELRDIAHAGQIVVAKATDVSCQDEVNQLATLASAELPNFSGLVNCAAVNGPKGLLEENSASEWIETIHINLIGTMLLCRAVIPHFRRRNQGKIVNFSGGGATSPRARFTAYAASKSGIVRLTETLAIELKDTNISVNAIAPGAVNTRMLDEVLEAGPERVGNDDYERALKQQRTGGTPPERAAQLCVKLLSRESDGISGRLISAVWDSWDMIASHKQEIMNSDLYTLRRIVPEDRQIEWK